MVGGRGHWRRAWRLAAVLAAIAASDARAQDAAPQAAGQQAAGPLRCNPAGIGTATVGKALDAGTVTLSDGRELRLAGIEAPERDEPHAAAAKSALDGLVAGREVVLQRIGTETDRHGRVIALVSLASEPGAAPVQQRLLAAGHARVAGRIGNLSCAEALWRAERTARGAGLGLWSLPYYRVRRAVNPGEVLAERGRFTIVEGNVLSVRESGATLYVNFGRRWSEDFTVTALKRRERAFAQEGLELKKLSGRTVRVRGTVEERGGPWIEATRPEQFEIAERD